MRRGATRGAVLVALALTTAASAGAQRTAPVPVAQAIVELQGAISLEDAAAAELVLGHVDAARAKLDTAAARLERLAGDVQSGSTLEQILRDAEKNDIGAHVDLGRAGGAAQARVKLNAAHALKERALGGLTSSLRKVFGIAETATLPAVSKAPAVTTVEYDVTVPAPGASVVSVVDDIRRPGDPGFVAVSVEQMPTQTTIHVESVVGDLGTTPAPAEEEKIVTGLRLPPDLFLLHGSAAAGSVRRSAVSIHTDALVDVAKLCARFDVSRKPVSLTDHHGRRLKAATPRAACLQQLKPTTVAPPPPSATYTCNGQIVKIFDNSNGNAVQNGAAAPTFSTNGKAYCVTSIGTYHWNGGHGRAPGKVGLTRVSGMVGVGPFAAAGSAGQNGAPNVNWQATVPTSPTPSVIDGTYKCSDSSPSTWSGNASSNGAFCVVYGIPAQRS